MKFTPTLLKQELIIDSLFTVHYFEFSKNYYFEGEAHEFWEFVYVDKGDVFVTANTQAHHLTKGQIIFHKPNEFHTITGNGIKAPNILIVSFKSDSVIMSFFEDKILTIADSERQMLARIISESRCAFITPLDDRATTCVERNEAADFGCEQFIKLSLEWLLLDLIRKSSYSIPKTPTSFIKENMQSEIFNKIVQYMEQNITRMLLLEDICKENMIGRSHLQKLFRGKSGGGAIEYFNKMKIVKAKEMIREGVGNFTDISLHLGYSSIHYFSRQFKTITNMTLTEYATSIKSMTNADDN